jgi:cystathionine gamma-synthase
MSSAVNPKKNVPTKNIATRSVRAGLESDAQHGSVVPPIYLSTNFAFESYGRPRKYDYTRSGNPTRDQLAAALADLEGGAGAVVTCTGLAAITLILATLPAGAGVVAPYDCYGGTYRLLSGLQRQGTLRVDFIDQGDAAALRAALAAGP